MKSFAQKKEELIKLRNKLSKAKITIFTSFAREGEKGLNVGEMRELKRELRAVNSEYLIGKKTLLDKAFNERGKKVDVFEFDGSLGIAFGYGNEAATAKSVFNFSEKNPALKCLGALFGGRFLGEKEFAELAVLPPRDVLIARIVGMIRYPLSGLVGVLQSSIRNLVLVLARVKK